MSDNAAAAGAKRHRTITIDENAGPPRATARVCEAASCMSGNANDITARSGWQEPGIKMDCRMNDERSLTCTRTDRKGSFQYSRD